MKDPLEKILRIGVFCVFTALILTVSFQVFSRIFFPTLSRIWTEELTRFLFIYAVAFAAPLAMKQTAYVNIDLIEKLPIKIVIIVKVAVEVIVAVLFLLVFYYGIQFTMLGIHQRAPTIKIPMAAVFMSIPIMGGFIFFYSIVNFGKFLRELKTKGAI